MFRLYGLSERADAENPDYAAEDVGLLKIQIDEFLGSLLNELNRVSDVRDREPWRPRYRVVEAIIEKSQTELKTLGESNV